MLDEERNDALVQREQMLSDYRAGQELVDKFQQEEQDCLERLAKVQKELGLIRDFREREQKKVETLREDMDKKDQEIKFIEDSLQPLTREKDKITFMVSTMQS